MNHKRKAAPAASTTRVKSEGMQQDPTWGRGKHFQERAAEPQVSPLRCAPVEMTKGGAVVDRSRAGLSTMLRSGRDDKGWGCCGPQQSLGNGDRGLSTMLCSGRDDKGEGVV